MATLEIIVAVDITGGFGKDGKIPWQCKEDMKRFSTISKACGVTVMGRHTYNDMLAMRGELTDEVKAKIVEKGILPGRDNYVISSTLKQEDVFGATVVSDLCAVRNKFFSDPDQRIAVIGGEKLYVQALASASKVHVTVMDGVYGCDRFIPLAVLDNFQIVKGNAVQTDVDGTTQTVRFLDYERVA